MFYVLCGIPFILLSLYVIYLSSIIIYKGFLDAIQYTQKILEELLTAVSGPRLQKYQVIRRYKLRKIIDEKTESLRRASNMVTRASEVGHIALI